MFFTSFYFTNKQTNRYNGVLMFLPKDTRNEVWKELLKFKNNYRQTDLKLLLQIFTVSIPIPFFILTCYCVQVVTSGRLSL